MSVLISVLYDRLKKFKKRKEKFHIYKKKLDENLSNEEDTCNLRSEFELFMNIQIDKEKPRLGRYIHREYVEKIMTYGYVLVSI